MSCTAPTSNRRHARRAGGRGGDPDPCSQDDPDSEFYGHPTAPCPACNGKGTVPAVVTLAAKCETCKGDGSVEGRNIASWDHCWSCDGDGFGPVGTATVVNCWPICAGEDYSHDDVPSVELRNDGSVWLYGDEWFTSNLLKGIDITGQVVGDPQPGRWMLELSEARGVQ